MSPPESIIYGWPIKNSHFPLLGLLEIVGKFTGPKI
jgi:hypothetical protein